MLHIRIQVQKVQPMPNSRQNPKPQSQIEKFREAARELEADDSEERFDRLVKQIAKASPPKEEKPATDWRASRNG